MRSHYYSCNHHKTRLYWKVISSEYTVLYFSSTIMNWRAGSYLVMRYFFLFSKRDTLPGILMCFILNILIFPFSIIFLRAELLCYVRVVHNLLVPALPTCSE